MNNYPAHIRVYTDESRDEPDKIQTVEEHCRQTGKYAAQSLSGVGLSKSAYLSGLTHDAGKLTKSYLDYITAAARKEKVQRGSVNHTFMAVRLLLERYHSRELEFSDVTCEVLAIAVGSHHELFDCIDENRKSGFDHRITKPDIGYEESRENFFNLCVGEAELDVLFREASAEMAPVLQRIFDMTDGEQFLEETFFYIGLLARLMSSSVIEGDRRDTAEFMNDARFPDKRSGEEIRRLWADCLEKVEKKLGDFHSDSPINAARTEISDRCRAFAAKPGGVYRLNVPTGAGKTLASLRYSLAHAEKWGKERIIFTSPLLSILDQNAAAIRAYIQNDSIILEHHSNLVHTDETPEELDMRELLTETWDSPIIITTLVQLLNTLFSGKTSSIRRFHSLSNSIIVIDEVQTVPGNMLSMFSLAVNFLSEIMGATVLLCSATQPCTEKISHPIHSPIEDIVSYDEKLWSAFRRTDIQPTKGMTLDSICDFAGAVLNECGSLLVVCNTKNEAAQIFRHLKSSSVRCFHLSAAMCMAHRKEVLKALRASLEANDGVKTLCVSTQVIEAGVDISFERVIRLLAGMDSAVQAAGRCNRNGKAGQGIAAPVYLAEYQGENLNRLPDIQAGKDASVELLAEYSRDKSKFDGRLDSSEAIDYYYQVLYKRMKAGQQDYPVKRKPYTLFDLLSVNSCYADEEAEGIENYFCRQAFKTAGSIFEVFEENTEDVIVPYREGEQIINDLLNDRAKYDVNYVKSLLERAKAYTVSLYKYQKDALGRHLIDLSGGAKGVFEYYDNDIGFSLESGTLDFLER